ncbi:MAG: transcriptional regulator [Alteromonadaceae bacterium]|nr:transcriptional regulator [Alteromonadaceae bacterium]
MYKSIHSEGHRALVTAFIETRRSAKMTQTDLAKKIGWKQSLIARVESGQRRIDVVDVVHWGRAVGTEPSVLFDIAMKAESCNKSTKG